MISFIERRRSTLSYRLLSAFVCFTFTLSLVVPPRVFAQPVGTLPFNLPAPGTMLSLSPSFTPPLLSGIKIYPENPFQFDFILNNGDLTLKKDETRSEAERAIKYFLAALTLPEDDLWVNLSPYEKDRIAPEKLGHTDLGRDLLAQDYILKQITASLIYPEHDLGKAFWNKIYQKAQELYGTTQIPVNTFNKVWIIPDKIVVYEPRAGVALVAESHLKVMLEEDYLALDKNMHATKNPETAKDTSKISSAIIKEIIIPAIEEEVNTGKNFSQLRQITNAIILATWFKKTLKDSLLGQVYVDQGKIRGVDLEDKNTKEKIYQQYLAAFKKGVYNYIKEDIDQETHQPVARKYFAGGLGYTGVGPLTEIITPGTGALSTDGAEAVDNTMQGKGSVVKIKINEAGPTEDDSALDFWLPPSDLRAELESTEEYTFPVGTTQAQKDSDPRAEEAVRRVTVLFNLTEIQRAIAQSYAGEIVNEYPFNIQFAADIRDQFKEAGVQEKQANDWTVALFEWYKTARQETPPDIESITKKLGILEAKQKAVVTLFTENIERLKDPSSPIVTEFKKKYEETFAGFFSADSTEKQQQQAQQVMKQIEAIIFTLTTAAIPVSFNRDEVIEAWESLKLPGTYASAVSRAQEQLLQSVQGARVSQDVNVRGGHIVYLSAGGQPLWVFHYGTNDVYHRLGVINLATGELLAKDILQESKGAFYKIHSNFLASVSDGKLVVHELKKNGVTRLSLPTPTLMPLIEDIEFAPDGQLVAYQSRKDEPGQPARNETALRFDLKDTRSTINPTNEDASGLDSAALESSDVENVNVRIGEILSIAQDIIGKDFIDSLNATAVTDNFAESVGISKDKALKNMTGAGIIDANGRLTSNIFQKSILDQFREIQIKSSSNPQEVDLTTLRLERILLNALNVKQFISRLANSARIEAEDVIDQLGTNKILPAIIAAWKMEEAEKAQDTKVKLSLIVSPSDFYQKNGIDVQFSIPEQREAGKAFQRAVLDYQEAVLRDMAQGGFNYRGGENVKYNVKEFFEKVFEPQYYEAIQEFINQQFDGGKKLEAIVTNGIGANDQFMWALVEMYNRNRPEGAPVWHHVTSAKDLKKLKGLNPQTTLAIDISRSGSTWEGVEVVKRLLKKGFTKRIVLANEGELKAVAGTYPQSTLRIGMQPDIGGRNIHRKTAIYYTALTVVGMFLPSMDAKVFAGLNHTFDEANDFANPDSMAVKSAQFLHFMMQTQGAEHIVSITNSKQLALTVSEMSQYIMEGSNKEHVISWGDHDLTTEPEYVLNNLANGPSQKKLIGLALLDKDSENYAAESKRVEALREKIPLLVFTIDTSKNKAFKGVSPQQQAPFDILWTDFVTTLTAFLRVDANSNPNVKVVRDLTKEYVAKWKEKDEEYTTDPIGLGQTDLLLSLGDPTHSDIGGANKERLSLNTIEDAQKAAATLVQQLVKNGMLESRDRLNIFVGADDAVGTMESLRNKAYLKDVVKKLGFIVETGLFPIRSHKGYEAALALRKSEEIKQGAKLLLGNKTINIFLNTRNLGDDEEFNVPFEEVVQGGKNANVNGATIHQTNDSMTFPNIQRMAQVSPTFLLEFNRMTPDVEKKITAFYDAFLDALAVAGDNMVTAKTIEQRFLNYTKIAEKVVDNDGGDDYFLKPTLLEKDANIREGDSVALVNFRGDRAEPILKILHGDPDFHHWKLKSLALKLLTFGVYNDRYYETHGLFGLTKDVPYSNTLGEIWAGRGLKQLRIAESEKFKHVTYFFDGLRDLVGKIPGLTTELVPSNKLERHDEMPEMKASAITDLALPYITGKTDKEAEHPKVDVAVINYANSDILGHFPNFDATVKGVRVVDEQIGRLWKTVQEAGGVLIITADHGSAEQMAKLDENGRLKIKDGKVVMNKAHAFDNKVDFIILGAGNLKLKDGGSLKNIAPTILQLQGIEKPKEMDAESLLVDYEGTPIKGPIVLAIRDGQGINKWKDPQAFPEAFQYDAVHQARLQAQREGKTLEIDRILTENPNHGQTEIWAHGEFVGHPTTQMGDSETGHSNMGVGRDIQTPLTRVNAILDAGEFANLPAVREVLDNAKKQGGRIHLVGMISPGGVHSHTDHILKLLTIISKEKDINDVVLHAIFDGRDTDVSGAESIEVITKHVLSLGPEFAAKFRIGSIAGRYYPMDRDGLNNDKKTPGSGEKLWLERTYPWYQAVVEGQGRTAEDLQLPIDGAATLTISSKETAIPRLETLSNAIKDIGINATAQEIFSAIKEKFDESEVNELSFFISNGLLVAVSPKVETGNQKILFIYGGNKSLGFATDPFSRHIKNGMKQSVGTIEIAKTMQDIMTVEIPASMMKEKRAMLAAIMENAGKKEAQQITPDIAFQESNIALTDGMKREVFSAQAEKMFLGDYEKRAEEAKTKFKELYDLLENVKQGKGGQLVLTKELVEKWGVKENLVKTLLSLARIAVAGMRATQNPLNPADLTFPMNSLLTLLTANELAEMSITQAKKDGSENLEAVIGGEVRFNTPLINSMLRQRLAAMGFTVHSPKAGDYLPIGATSFITTLEDIIMTLYDTSSHAARMIYASKIMGFFAPSLSLFEKNILTKNGKDVAAYEKATSEGAQLLIDEMVKLANGVAKKIDHILETGESLTLDFTDANHPNIRLDLDNQDHPQNIDVSEQYATYLSGSYINKGAQESIVEALNNGLQLGYGQANGSSFEFNIRVFFRLLGEAVKKIIWDSTQPDPFFGGTGMGLFNPKGNQYESIKKYVETEKDALNIFFGDKNIGFGVTTVLSDENTLQGVQKEIRELNQNKEFNAAQQKKETDLLEKARALRFEVFPAEAEFSILRAKGIPFTKLSNGNLLAYFEPALFDYSQDVSLLEVVVNSGLPALLKDKPIGFIEATTDPDGDRYVVMQVEKNDKETQDRLQRLNVAYLKISDEKLLVVYTPNQNFFDIQGSLVKTLKERGEFKQHLTDFDDYNDVTFFGITTTVSTSLWRDLWKVNKIPTVSVPVGFKEIARMERLVESQIRLNEIREMAGLRKKRVIVHDIFGKAIDLGYNPRLLFAGEESGGMVVGKATLLKSTDGTRQFVGWREKNAVEAHALFLKMASEMFHDARKAAGESIPTNELYQNQTFLNGMLLSRQVEEKIKAQGSKNTAELRTDFTLLDLMLLNRLPQEESQKYNQEAIDRRNYNDTFFIGLAFALQDGNITLQELKTILKDAFASSEDVKKQLTTVTGKDEKTVVRDLNKWIEGKLTGFYFQGDGVYMEFKDGAYAIIRPSGTDPKIKGYPSTEDAYISALLSNSIVVLNPKTTDLKKWKEILTNKGRPDLLDVQKVMDRKQSQYERALEMDTPVKWIGQIQDILVKKFGEAAESGLSDISVVLGPRDQKETLKYVPWAGIVYVNWDFDQKMQDLSSVDAQGIQQSFEEALAQMQTDENYGSKKEIVVGERIPTSAVLTAAIDSFETAVNLFSTNEVENLAVTDEIAELKSLFTNTASEKEPSHSLEIVRSQLKAKQSLNVFPWNNKQSTDLQNLIKNLTELKNKIEILNVPATSIEPLLVAFDDLLTSLKTIPVTIKLSDTSSFKGSLNRLAQDFNAAIGVFKTDLATAEKNEALKMVKKLEAHLKTISQIKTVQEYMAFRLELVTPYKDLVSNLKDKSLKDLGIPQGETDASKGSYAKFSAAFKSLYNDLIFTVDVTTPIVESAYLFREPYSTPQGTEPTNDASALLTEKRNDLNVLAGKNTGEPTNRGGWSKESDLNVLGGKGDRTQDASALLTTEMDFDTARQTMIDALSDEVDTEFLKSLSDNLHRYVAGHPDSPQLTKFVEEVFAGAFNLCRLIKERQKGEIGENKAREIYDFIFMFYPKIIGESHQRGKGIAAFYQSMEGAQNTWPQISQRITEEAIRHSRKMGSSIDDALVSINIDEFAPQVALYLSKEQVSIHTSTNHYTLKEKGDTRYQVRVIVEALLRRQGIAISLGQEFLDALVQKIKDSPSNVVQRVPVVREKLIEELSSLLSPTQKKLLTQKGDASEITLAKSDLKVLFDALLQQYEFDFGADKWDFLNAAMSELTSQSGDKDASALDLGTGTGGIDLSAKRMNLQIRRDENGIPLPVNMQPIKDINIQGFTFSIIDIKPAVNLPLILGINTDNLPAHQKTSKADEEDSVSSLYLKEENETQELALAN